VVRIYRHFAGYPNKVFGFGQGFSNLNSISISSPFNCIGPQFGYIITESSKLIRLNIELYLIVGVELYYRRILVLCKIATGKECVIEGNLTSSLQKLRSSPSVTTSDWYGDT